MTFTTDNRFCVGSSGHTPPDTALAAYGARWIDQGDNIPDMVPDRQGFAYATVYDRQKLISHLEDERLRDRAPYSVSPGGGVWSICDWPFLSYVRRDGGYFYVDAWIEGS